MRVYLSLARLGAVIEEHYQGSGERLRLSEAAKYLFDTGEYCPISPNPPIIAALSSAPEEEFLARSGELYAEFDPEYIEKNLMESIKLKWTIPDWTKGFPANVVANYLFRHQHTKPHQNLDYFEFNYLYRGKCTLFYENTRKELGPGQICLITPSATRDMRIDSEDTFLIQLYMNYKTFYSTFISILSETNILSNFFKDALLNQNSPNFLLLNTGESEEVRFIARQLYLEQYRYDFYAPRCSANWLQQMFFYVLRTVSDDYNFAISSDRVDFAPILKYLNVNFRSTSLQEVADKFHYTPSYLSTAIKDVTGKTYTELIRDLKMASARQFLETGKKSIEEIATLVGYNSADQFTKTFRSCYGTTPSQYRKEHRLVK